MVMRLHVGSDHAGRLHGASQAVEPRQTRKTSSSGSKREIAPTMNYATAVFMKHIREMREREKE